MLKNDSIKKTEQYLTNLFKARFPLYYFICIIIHNNYLYGSIIIFSDSYTKFNSQRIY